MNRFHDDQVWSHRGGVSARSCDRLLFCFWFFFGTVGGGGGFNFLVLEMTSWKTFLVSVCTDEATRSSLRFEIEFVFVFFLNRFTETICDCDPRFCQRKRTARFRRKQNKNETFHSIFLEKRNRKTIKEMIKH